MVLSNAELMIMQIIAQNPNKTGYEINKFVQKFDYNKWAGVGKTSVYNGLKKLVNKKLLESHINSDKIGKGPLPICYNISNNGSQTLKQDMLETIETARERDQRFDLTISAIHLLTITEIAEAFCIRKKFLNDEFSRLTSEYAERKECILEGVKLLYDRMLMSLENELKFTEKILQK